MSEEVNVAELRRALSQPPVKVWFITDLGVAHQTQMESGIIVDRPTLAALLDAYERDQEADRRTAALRAHPDYEEAGQDIGKKPGPGDLLSTDEEIRALIHGDVTLDITKMPGYRWGYEAGYGEAQKAIPASWLTTIEAVLDRVLAGEPAAQVVRDFTDEHGDTIEGLERVERLVRLLRELQIGVELTSWQTRPQVEGLKKRFLQLLDEPL